MKRLDAYPNSIGPFTIVMPNKDSPAASIRHTGPGWSWMDVAWPWSGSGPSARYRWAAFKQSSEARADLQQLLDEGVVVRDGGRTARVLRNAEGIQEFILTAATDRAFAVYRVGSGESCSLGGCRFYNKWADMLHDNPDIRRRIHGEFLNGRPVIM